MSTFLASLSLGNSFWCDRFLWAHLTSVFGPSFPLAFVTDDLSIFVFASFLMPLLSFSSNLLFDISLFRQLFRAIPSLEKNYLLAHSMQTKQLGRVLQRQTLHGYPHKRPGNHEPRSTDASWFTTELQPQEDTPRKHKEPLLYSLHFSPFFTLPLFSFFSLFYPPRLSSLLFHFSTFCTPSLPSLLCPLSSPYSSDFSTPFTSLFTSLLSSFLFSWLLPSLNLEVSLLDLIWSRDNRPETATTSHETTALKTPVSGNGVYRIPYNYHKKKTCCLIRKIMRIHWDWGYPTFQTNPLM